MPARLAAVLFIDSRRSVRCYQCTVCIAVVFLSVSRPQVRPNKKFHLGHADCCLRRLHDHVTSGGGAASLMLRTPTKSREPSQQREEHIEDLVQQRASRRLQGLRPEYGLLPEKRGTNSVTNTTATMTAAVSPATVVMQQPREPPTFRGSSIEDPESWLETYDQVASFNNWDSEKKLRHVYFYLADAARMCFEDWVSALQTCDLCRTTFLRTFTSVVHKERAAAMLETRVQLPNEKIAIYTEEMNRLFRHADPSMPEEKKVGFLMRGVKQELFAGLIRNPPKTVAEFASEASTIEKTLEMHMRQYNRSFLPRSYADVQALGSADLHEMI